MFVYFNVKEHSRTISLVSFIEMAGSFQLFLFNLVCKFTCSCHENLLAQQSKESIGEEMTDLHNGLPDKLRTVMSQTCQANRPRSAA